ncbi:MAG: hypothetical protein V4443_06375 [Pseudomonadota bacterium]
MNLDHSKNIVDCIPSMSVVVACILLPMSGCTSISPHANFLQALNGSIGRGIDNVPSYHWPHAKDLIETKHLQNGNIENTYKYIRTCRYIFEVNPNSRSIVGARYEGSERDCIIAL